MITLGNWTFIYSHISGWNVHRPEGGQAWMEVIVGGRIIHVHGDVDYFLVLLKEYRQREILNQYVFNVI